MIPTTAQITARIRVAFTRDGKRYTGVLMGYNAQYHTVRVGFLAQDGTYSGVKTTVGADGWTVLADREPLGYVDDAERYHTPTTAHRLTGQVIDFGALMFGDRFRFVGDLEGTAYATVVRTQDYVGGAFSAFLADGTEHYGGTFKKVVLLHRAPDCACGGHVDLCWNECEWPAELEDLWSGLYVS